MNARRAIPIVLAAGLPSCMSTVFYEADFAGFNERIRLDRQAPGPGQGCPAPPADCFDPTFGNFRSRGEDVVAELYPSSLPAPYSPDNLPRGDCLWLAYASSRSQGEGVALSWEGLWRYKEGVNPARPYVGLCRFRDPVTGLYPEFGDFPPPPSVPPTGTTHVVTDPARYEQRPVPVVLPEDGDLAVTSDLHFLGLRLRQFTAGPDRDNTCRPEPFGDDPQPVTVSQNCPFEEEKVSETGYDHGGLTACGARCVTVPDRDTTYELAYKRMGRFLKPNVMVVRDTREIKRPMSEANAQTFVWDTPVKAGPTPANGVRWQETFSPHVRVRTARFFRREANGAETPLADIAGGELCVRETPTSTVCRWTCRVGADGVFDLWAAAACSRGGTEATPALTPTYDTDLLSSITGATVPGPLQWRITFNAPPGPGVFVQFGLQAALPGGAGLRARAPEENLGRVQKDGVVQRWTRLTNVGSTRLRVERVEVQPYPGASSHPEEFEVLVADRPRPVPLPVDFILPGAGSEKFEVRRGEDFDLWPLVEAHDTDGPGLILRPLRLDRQEAQVYGEPVQFEGDVGVYLNPKADFVESARLYSAAWRPLTRLMVMARAVPFELAPSEPVDILITARPRGTGDRVARLVFLARSVGNANEVVQIAQNLYVDALLGPTLVLSPRGLVFTPADERPRALLVENTGQVDLNRGAITFSGPDAGRFGLMDGAPSRLLRPGEAEVVLIGFGGRRCVDPATTVYSARLSVASNGGTDGIELRAQGTAAWCSP